MNIKMALRILTLTTIPVILFFVLTSVNAEEHKYPIDRSFSKEILDNYRKKSDEYVARNLNRFAIDRLEVYNHFLDSLYTKEKSDTLAFIEANYATQAKARTASIATLKKEIALASAEKSKLETSFWALFRYAALAFGVWFGLVLVFVQFRKRRMKNAAKNFDNSAVQLETLEDLSSKAERLFTEFNSKKQQIEKLDSEITKLEAVQSKWENPDKAQQEYISRVSKIRKTIDAEKRIVDSILSQSASGDEKVTVDINAICDAYMEIAYRGLKNAESFNCQVSRDFEKKLPGVQMNPSAVGTLLLNVLSNAFESVKEKNDLGIKGYQPKVSISTRVLPKFLQVRIKDNGTGMNDQLLQSAGQEFFTTRTMSPRPGLGLSIAKAIIEEHKGEIRIESEEGNSTDVYIKFYLK
jgi:signal transduction histidine kinase